MDCLEPYLELLRMSEPNGPITIAALESLINLLEIGLFEQYSKAEAVLALRHIIAAISKLSLEGEALGHEFALARLLDLLVLMVEGRRKMLSDQLGEADMATILWMAFSALVLPRNGELLRRLAERACLVICRAVLGRVAEADFIPSCSRDGGMAACKAKILYPGTRPDEPEPLPPQLAALEAELEALRLAEEAKAAQEAGGAGDGLVAQEIRVGPADQQSRSASASPLGTSVGGAGALVASPARRKTSKLEPASPYGIAFVVEVIEYLLGLLEVGERRNTDRLRALVLKVINEFIEHHHDVLESFPPLWRIVATKLTRISIQLLMTVSESVALALPVHQCIASVYGRYRRRLVAPTELLLNTLTSLLGQKPAPGKPQSRVGKEYYLEMIAQFCMDESFIAELYVVYECGEAFGYVLTDLISSICAAALVDPKNAPALDAPTYIIATEILIMLLGNLESAQAYSPSETDEEAMGRGRGEGDGHSASQLGAARKLKGLHRQSAELFNKNPKDAFAFLVEHRLTSDPATPQETARYLRRTPGLDKKTIGEILSKPSNAEILNEFLSDFDLAELQLDEALRVVLESFRLPGESQQIERIMEALAALYFKATQGKAVFKNQDAVFTLAYSIIMLNTDQHNKQVRHRMSVEDFIRNNRGINDGTNFEESFLRCIYVAIRDKEIVLPEEQAGETAFHYTWNEQLKKYPEARPMPHYDFGRYAMDVAELLWQPALSCSRTLILNPRTDRSSKLAVRGLQLLGAIADRFLGPEAMDELARVLTECLAFSDIAINPAGNQLPRYLARSELFRALVRCFFDQFRLHGGSVREAWGHYVTHSLFLSQATVLSLATFEADTPSVSGSSRHTRSPTTAGSPGGKSDTGLLSTLSQYLVASPVQPLADPETRSKAMEFIKSCRLDEIIRDSRFLPKDSLVALIRAMVEEVRIARPAIWETETLVFLVDLIVHTAWSNRDRMATFWPLVFNRFSELAKDLSVPSTIREHVILGLGKLSLRFADRPEMQREVVQFFQLLCYVPPELFQSLAEPALSIVLRIVELDPPILHGTDIWPHYFTVLALAGRSKSCGPFSFGLLTTIVREDAILFPLEFYSEYVDLLNGFIATAALSPPSPAAGSPLTEAPPPTPLQLAVQAVYKFAQLDVNIHRLAQEGTIGEGQVWSDYVIPVHCAIAQQCYHPLRDVRQSALSLLQRIILSSNFAQLGLPCLFEEFRLVLLPLSEELQRPELRLLDGNVEEIQVRTAALIGRVWLSNLALLFPGGGGGAMEGGGGEVEGIWRSILQHLLRFLQGRSDVLRESIPETIKNMLLVMASSGMLRPPLPGEVGGDGSAGSLWLATWSLLDAVMPTARAEILEIGQARQRSEAVTLKQGPEQEQVEGTVADSEMASAAEAPAALHSEMPESAEEGATPASGDQETQSDSSGVPPFHHHHGHRRSEPAIPSVPTTEKVNDDDEGSSSVDLRSPRKGSLDSSTLEV